MPSNRIAFEGLSSLCIHVAGRLVPCPTWMMRGLTEPTVAVRLWFRLSLGGSPSGVWSQFERPDIDMKVRVGSWRVVSGGRVFCWPSGLW